MDPLPSRKPAPLQSTHPVPDTGCHPTTVPPMCQNGGAEPGSRAQSAQSEPSFGGQLDHSNPIRHAYEQNLRALSTQPIHIYTNADGFIDGDAMNFQAAQRGTMAGRNLAAINVLGNDGGDHQKTTFRAAQDGIPRALPPVLERRGVTQSMFMADMQKMHDLSDEYNKQMNNECIAACLTCGFSFLYICLAETVSESSDRRYARRLSEHIDDMNRRYSPYRVTWERSFIPYSGTYVSYET